MINKIKVLLIVFILLSLSIYQVMAVELSGKEIFERANTLETVDDSEAEMEMTIIHKSGKKRIRMLSVKSLEKEDGIEMSMMRFLEPADVRGTGFLSIECPDDSDESYLYLPAMGRPRRLSSDERGGSFMSSDFTYEDISFTLDDYNHQLLGTEEIESREVYVVESIPKTYKIKEDVGFAKRISYIEKERFILLKSEYFEDDGKKIKVLNNSNFVEVKDNVWLVTYMEMADLEKDSKTILEYDDFMINTGLSEDYFSIRQLTRPI